METKEYVLELLRNGLWIFPIKGKGQDVDEAKRPMSFREKDETITWKDPRILNYSEELARRGHQAWAIWLLKSQRFGIDLDLYKRSISYADIVGGLRDSGLYIELSGRGGLHVVGSLVSDRVYRLIVDPAVSGLEYKHDGYFIVYPTVLRTLTEEYRYEKVAGDLLSTSDIEVSLPVVSRVLSDVFGLDLVMRLEEAGGGGMVRIAGSKRIEGLKLDIDGLGDRQITALLYLLFREAGCEGMKKLTEHIWKYGVVPVRKEMYSLLRIPRTTRWIVQYIYSSVLGWLGFSAGRVRAWMLSWRFIDENEEPRGDSLNNALINVYRYGKLLLILRGGCPMCLAFGRESCSETPVIKVMRLREEKIREIVEFVAVNTR